MPGVFTETCEFFSPEEIDYEHRLGDRKTMINVGSVGQPRDGDPRAAYIVYDTEERALFYRRAAYDIKSAQAKILKAGLPDTLALRLEIGA